MKIGVLGPPGTGKSKFARALAKKYELKVVDGYVNRLQKSTGLALGPWSSYPELFMVAGLRMVEEAKADENRIVVGTILDTLIYAAVHADIALHKNLTAHQAAYLNGRVAIEALSMWYTDAWDYHIAFHLPYTEEGDHEQWELNIDVAYRPVIDTYLPPYVYTLQGPAEERVELASEVIDIALKEEIAQPLDEQTSAPEVDE